MYAVGMHTKPQADQFFDTLRLKQRDFLEEHSLQSQKTLSVVAKKGLLRFLKK
jgi:hypothetical protein